MATTFTKVILHDCFYLLHDYNLGKPIYTLVVTGAVSLVDTNLWLRGQFFKLQVVKGNNPLQGNEQQKCSWNNFSEWVCVYVSVGALAVMSYLAFVVGGWDVHLLLDHVVDIGGGAALDPFFLLSLQLVSHHLDGLCPLISGFKTYTNIQFMEPLFKSTQVYLFSRQQRKDMTKKAEWYHSIKSYNNQDGRIRRHGWLFPGQR